MCTVYLHIGMPRTGTTTLQNFLAQNNQVLEKFHMHYPDLGVVYPNVGGYRNGHFLREPYRGEDGRVDRALPSREYDAAMDKLEELGKKYEILLLSEEDIWQDVDDRAAFYRKARTDFAQRGMDLKAILYLRQQDLWVESMWARRIRTGSTCTFEAHCAEWKAKGFLDHYERVRVMRETFGEDRLIIRIFEKGAFRGREKNLHSDFLDIFGLSLSDGFEVGTEVRNSSISGDYLEIKRILNALPELREKYHPFSRHLLKVQGEEQTDRARSACFSAEERREFLEPFAASNRKLALELGMEDGKLFREPVKDSPKYTVDQEELLRSVILFYGETIDSLLRELESQKEKIARMTQENREWKKRCSQDLRELRETALFYRLRRKARHLLGKDNASQ